MARYHGVIFDLDGVLTDTAEFHYRAWRRLADEEGLPFDRETNELLRGVPRRRSLEIILGDRDVPEARILEWMERKNAYYTESLKSLDSGHLLPGAADVLAYLAELGVPAALASASKNARFILGKLGIESLFAGIADGYSVVRGKPEPDVFVFAAGLVGIPVESCLVVEDAEAGVEGALAGGFGTVGIGPSERVGKAGWVIEDLRTFPRAAVGPATG